MGDQATTERATVVTEPAGRSLEWFRQDFAVTDTALGRWVTQDVGPRDGGFH